MRRRKEHLPIGRSENMRRIRSGETKPEILLRGALYKKGLRYRIHYKGLPGKPDIVFPKYRLAVFIHGCFWHQHPGCREASDPLSNRDYWLPKLRLNVERDKEHNEMLLLLGYDVLTLWECQIEKNPEEAARAVIARLNQSHPKDALARYGRSCRSARRPFAPMPSRTSRGAK